MWVKIISVKVCSANTEWNMQEGQCDSFLCLCIIMSIIPLNRITVMKSRNVYSISLIQCFKCYMNSPKQRCVNRAEQRKQRLHCVFSSYQRTDSLFLQLHKKDHFHSQHHFRKHRQGYENSQFLQQCRDYSQFVKKSCSLSWTIFF